MKLDAFIQSGNSELNLHRYEVSDAGRLSETVAIPFWDENIVQRSGGNFWSGEVSSQDSVDAALKRFKGNISWTEQNLNRRHLCDYTDLEGLDHALDIWIAVAVDCERALAACPFPRLYMATYQTDFGNDLTISLGLIREEVDFPLTGLSEPLEHPSWQLLIGGNFPQAE